MGWNGAYWDKKQEMSAAAKRHHKRMLHQYPSEILSSVQDTVVWDSTKLRVCDTDRSGKTEIVVDNTDTVSGLFEHMDGRTVVLNFASYKNPGGGFMNGSSAQEESLCHASTLYEVLTSSSLSLYYGYNNSHKNNALYEDRALWSPSIIFEKDGKTVRADVITCAAPNRKAYIGYAKGADEARNLETLRSRIFFVADVIKAHMDVRTAILGAFGCGVFGQDPGMVAGFFKEAFQDTEIKTVYAVIDKGGHSKKGAYTLFQEVFADQD